MRQASKRVPDSAEKTVRDIRRATRRHHSAEEKIRIVLEGLRGEDSIAELCRKEGINQNLYYRWSKEFLEAGKKRLAGDTAREATSDEVKELKAEARQLKETLAEVLIENQDVLKKTTENEKFAAMRCQVNFFKDLVSSDGRSVSTLQHSIEISGAENITSAVEAAKRRYEQLRRVPIWSLCADWLELESEGKRTSYRPTRDEFVLIPIPGRHNAVSDFAIES
jgi:transposase